MRAALIAVALLFVPTTARAEPDSLPAAVVRPAVVLVSVAWHGWMRDKRTGEVFGGANGYDVKVSCSGVVVSAAGHVATSSQCVHTGPLGGGGALITAALADLKQAGRVGDEAKARAQLVEHGVAEGPAPDRPLDRTVVVERVDGDRRDAVPATVVELTAPDQGDVAVLEVGRTGWPAAAIRSDSDDVPSGTSVTALGFAALGDDRPEATSARIGDRRDGAKVRSLDTAVPRTTVGGPIVDEDGAVVGLVSYDQPDAVRSKSASEAATLRKVLSDKAINAEVADVDREYRAGLTAYFAGDHDDAVASFDAVLAASPTHRQAAEYRKLAVERGGAAGAPKPYPHLALVTGVLALTGLAGGTGMVLERRRRRSTVDDQTPD